MQQVSTVIAAYLLIIGLAAQAGATSNIAYQKRWVQGVPVHVVTVNLNSPNVRVSPAIAKHGIGTSEGFGSMLSRLQPEAAVTGTFFCVRSLIPVGDLVVDSKPVNLGSVGTAVCFSLDNAVEFKDFREAKAADLTKYVSVVATGPRLVNGGVAYVSPWKEGFRDPALYRRAQRSALGLTQHNKLLLVTVNQPIYLSKMAKVMRDLGSVHAVNLDGGSSTALYYKGRVPSHPGRRMTNLLVVYESPAKYARVKPQLAPSPIIARTSSKS